MNHSWPNHNNITAFSWKDQSEPQITSDRTVGVLAKTGTMHLLHANQYANAVRHMPFVWQCLMWDNMNPHTVLIYEVSHAQHKTANIKLLLISLSRFPAIKLQISKTLHLSRNDTNRSDTLFWYLKEWTKEIWQLLFTPPVAPFWKLVLPHISFFSTKVMWHLQFLVCFITCNTLQKKSE